MQYISSLHNQQIKHIQRLLQQRKYCREQQETVLEGIHLLSSYVDAGFSPKAVFIPESKINHQDIQAIIGQVDGVILYQISDDLAQKLSSLTQACEVLSLIEIPAIKSLPVQEDCIVLESIQDPGNVGTILRSSLASGVKHVVLNQYCADIYSPKVLRSAMGAHFGLSIYEGVDLAQFILDYQGEVYLTTLSKEKIISLYDLNLQAPHTWIFGNEGAGVSQELSQLVDYGVHIPMLGQTESLNVAMAATICLFEQMRQRL